VVIPVATRMMVAIGTSNVIPKARNSVMTKSRYLLISVMTVTPSGATRVKKPNTSGKTTK